MQTIRNNPPRRKFDGRVAPVRRSLVLIALALACFALSPVAHGQDGAVGPPQNGNTAEGLGALKSLTTGFRNTAMGFDALYSDTDGFGNTALGYSALSSNTDGYRNTATGGFALTSNTTGFFNTATGLGALFNNTTGYSNTVIGHAALESNTTGIRNSAVGDFALFNNTGDRNTANGDDALFGNTTGNLNIGLGYLGGANLDTGNNNIDISNEGVAGESNTIRIGEPVALPPNFEGVALPAHTATFIAGIYGKTASGGTAVYINSSGRLGTMTSSARFKEKIQNMGDASDVLLSLRPVTFRYKAEVDPHGLPQFGLVAEEVEKVNPDLIVRDAKGEPYSVRYEAVNAMLLNEFLKEHRKVQAQDRKLQAHGATIAQLKKGMEVLTASLKEQASQIQKVSAQLEMSKAAPRTVVNNR